MTVIRGQVAAWVSYAVRRHVERGLRDNGTPPPLFLLDVLKELEVRAGIDLPTRSASGTRVATVDEGEWVTTAEAASAVGYSERYIRRLASTHRVRARRVGERAWLIDLQSLRGMLQSRAA